MTSQRCQRIGINDYRSRDFLQNRAYSLLRAFARAQARTNSQHISSLSTACHIACCAAAQNAGHTLQKSVYHNLRQLDCQHVAAAERCIERNEACASLHCCITRQGSCTCIAGAACANNNTTGITLMRICLTQRQQLAHNLVRQAILVALILLHQLHRHTDICQLNIAAIFTARI